MVEPDAPRVLLLQPIHGVDHFRGLDGELESRGFRPVRLVPDQPPPEPDPRVRVVVITDPDSALARRIVAVFPRVPIVLLMDGLTEYRNTFVNPDVEPGFLRPAPCDVVACAGETDRRVLEALGNRAIATGLPRLEAVSPIAPAPERRVLVATANRPAFNDDERARLRRALDALRLAASREGIQILWRLRDGLDTDLGVTNAAGSLDHAMGSARAVVTTPSTVLAEAMLAGLPTGVLHPHPTPLWHPAPLRWCPEAPPPTAPALADMDPRARETLNHIAFEADRSTPKADTAATFLRDLIEPNPVRQRHQHRALAAVATPTTPSAAANLADLVASVATEERRRPRQPRPLLRIPRAMPRQPGIPRVVNCIPCDWSPVGGVQTWAARLERAFASAGQAHDLRTLYIATNPDIWRRARSCDPPSDRSAFCVIDPTDHPLDQIETVERALRALDPDLVLPNGADLTWAAAARLRQAGVRTLAVAHTDDHATRRLLATYDAWEAAVGVSSACEAWLRDLAEGRPVERIVYGVPIHETPRPKGRPGMPRFAYIGRMCQTQKRIDDLLEVVAGLERRGVDCEFHFVGDGPHLAPFRQGLARLAPARVRVTVHGPCDPQWVAKFLPTIDASVLVSAYEGTSITMLEAMGAAVVPAVTRVSSGVDDWIRDGETGVVVPAGRPDAMAERLAHLARHPGEIDRIAAGARERAARELSIDRMARRYAGAFDRALKAPIRPTQPDLVVRLIEAWRYGTAAQHDHAARDRVTDALVAAGCNTIAFTPDAGEADALILDEGEPCLPALRASGVPVAVLPTLLDASVSGRLLRAVDALQSNGFGRIALYGIGRMVRAAPQLADRSAVVGFIDDNPPSWRSLFGLPVVGRDEGVSALCPDAVLVANEAWAQRIAQRAATLAEAGARVFTLDDALAATQAPVAASAE